MIKIIAVQCILSALILDTLSYYRQIAKILKTKKSSQVSSMSYVFKILKGMFSTIGLALYANWVGFGMEVFMVVVYVVSLTIIAKYKPKSWSLWK